MEISIRKVPEKSFSIYQVALNRVLVIKGVLVSSLGSFFLMFIKKQQKNIVRIR